MGPSSHLPCNLTVCLTFSLKNLAEAFSAGDVHHDDDTHAQDDHPDGELATPPSTASRIDELSETWPVNDPLAIGGVVLAKTPRTSCLHIIFSTLSYFE